jgi:perosamine synthetase
MHNILIHKPFFDEEDKKAVLGAIESTFVSGDGPQCREFEADLSKYTGFKHCLFTNSATTALEAVLRAWNFSPEDEVVVPAFTFTSTALAPLYNNLKVVFCDVDENTGLMTLELLKEVITKKTKCVIPVDYAGCPVDMEPIQKYCNERDIKVVQDCAQSIGTFYKQRHTGFFADAAVFSFHGTKNLTTGEGGAIVTNDDDLFNVAKLIRDKGTNKYSFLSDNQTKGYYEYQVLGNSYVQSNINAMLGITQLKKLDWMNERRSQIAVRYDKIFDQVGVKLLKPSSNTTRYNHHLYGILEVRRFELLDFLTDRGINANVHYTPMHFNELYADFGDKYSFPGAVKFYERLLRIPIYPSLTDVEVDYIIENIKEFYVS